MVHQSAARTDDSMIHNVHVPLKGLKLGKVIPDATSSIVLVSFSINVSPHHLSIY